MDPLLAGAAGSQVASHMGNLDSGSHLSGQTNEQMFQQYRGAIPVKQGAYHLVTAEDPDYKKPVMRYQVHAKVYNLEDDDSDVDGKGIAAYQKALQDIYDAAGGAEMIACEIKTPENGVPTWTAFLQWRTSIIQPANTQGTNLHQPTVS